MARTNAQKSRRKAHRTSKPRRKGASKKRSPRKKPAQKRKSAQKKKTVRKSARLPVVRKKKTTRSAGRRRRNPVEADLGTLSTLRGLGPESAGQSGDIQGLPEAEIADSESVEELAEEGQAFEAELIDAVENAPEREVRTREVPEDDVPEEYLDED
jgi:hypothetical protein